MRTSYIVPMLAVLAGCVRSAPPRPYVSTAPIAPPPPRTAPLAPGWAWPHAAQLFTKVRLSPGVVRPFDAARIRLRAKSNDPCRPVEIIPGLFSVTDCSPLQKMTAPSAAGVRGSALRSGAPPMMDLRDAGLDGPVKSQQMTGVCWAFAVSSVMENELIRQGVRAEVSPLHLVATGAWDDLHAAGKTDAIAAESVWPYDPAKACKLKETADATCEDAYHVKQGSWRSDPMLVAEGERANAAGGYAVEKVDRVALTFDAMADVVSSGQAVFAAFNIDHASWGRATGGVIEDYTGQERGAHAVTVVGYRVAGPRGRELLLKNSWGLEWGESGYAWISEAMVTRHGVHAYAFQVQASGVGATQAQPPVVLPLPLPSLPKVRAPACAPGQPVDPIFGQCIPVPNPVCAPTPGDIFGCR